MAGAIASTGNLVILCAGKIQELGDNWYKQNEDWDKFPDQVESLQQKLKVWESESYNRGLSNLDSLTQALSAARSCLMEEQKKLESREGTCLSKFCLQVGRTLFPAQVGRSIQVAIDAFDNVPKFLEGLDQAKILLDNRVKGSADPDSVPSDPRYVPLKASEKSIFETLDNVDGPQVVLLHGGAGKGKSTVAWSTVSHYSNNNVHQFDLVFFLSCGPKARIEDTLLELVSRLGSEPFANPEDNVKIRSIKMRKQVRSLLAERKVLLILDDVSNEEFVRNIIDLCGRGVKCLITSLQGTLCRSLDESKRISIEIQDIDQDHARKVVASHLGFPNQEIPDHLQKIADRMIDETDLNLLALASLASVIDRKRSNELSEWEHVSSDFIKFEVIPVALFQKDYPRSLWTTMRLSIKSLDEDARNLLLLTQACAGPSVPEEVIQILYANTKRKGALRPFSSVRSELESRQLIKIITFTSSGLGHPQRTWQMHSLQKRYIEDKMRDARDSVIAAIVVAGSVVASTDADTRNVHILDQPGKALVNALCALYLDESLPVRATMTMGFPLEVFNKQKRNAIEPVTRLLGQSLSDRWTATARQSATKVFLSYIYYTTWEDRSILELLRNPYDSVAVAMCKALRDMALVDENLTLQLDESTREVMKALVSNFTGKGIETIRKKAALEVVARFAENEHNDNLIASFDVLEGIVDCLRTAGSPSQTDE
ncbi:unnamed protein product [Calypogeia fissa]